MVSVWIPGPVHQSVFDPRRHVTPSPPPKPFLCQWVLKRGPTLVGRFHPLTVPLF